MSRPTPEGTGPKARLMIAMGLITWSPPRRGTWGCWECVHGVLVLRFAKTWTLYPDRARQDHRFDQEGIALDALADL